uniref:BPTI/Kunitz inhibitor domain-containing protein n=1 Tax=Strongyloides stercoralis TaxID=6248 RepID=A0A0K0EKC2_STRER
MIASPETSNLNQTKSRLTKSKRTHKGSSMKFEAGFITIILFGCTIFIIDIIDKSNSYVRYIINEVILFNIIILLYQWVLLYISSVTREKRALFDEENILETYQPRAYTHGHLFVPDPPTPAEIEAKNAADKKAEAEKNAFIKMRDNHYENMYQKALELSMALEVEDKAKKNSDEKKSIEKVEKENKKSNQSSSDNENSSDKKRKENKTSNTGSDQENSSKEGKNKEAKNERDYIYF